MSSKKKKPVLTQSAIRQDCVEAMLEKKVRPTLIVADPPYNIKQPYAGCDDDKPADEYEAWTLSWLTAAVKMLDPAGSLWVFAPDEWVSEIDLMCRRQLGMHKRRHVIWAFTFGQASQRNFTRSHCHLLYMVKKKAVSKLTFNDQAVRVPSARQLVYKDGRAQPKGKLPDATWMLLKDQMEPYMTPDTDTWLESRVCGTFNEKKKHSPNQIPVPIMERIVLSCSNPGDWVVDPFAGTGSSGVACALHGRNWLGYDVSKLCVNESNLRIKEAVQA